MKRLMIAAALILGTAGITMATTVTASASQTAKPLTDRIVGLRCKNVTSWNTQTSRAGNLHGQMCVSMIVRTSPAGNAGVKAKVGFTVRSGGLSGIFVTHMYLKVCDNGHSGCSPEESQYSLGSAHLTGPKHAQVESTHWYPVSGSGGISVLSVQAVGYGLTMGWRNTDQIACYGGCNFTSRSHPQHTLSSGWLNG